MGTTCYYDRTLNEALAYEIGDWKILARGDGGSAGDGRSMLWLAIEPPPDRGKPFIALAYYSRHGSDRMGNKETCIKMVDESMGPGDLNVPDAVWNAVPNDPSDRPDSYGSKWRAEVAEHRVKYPYRLRDLSDADIGRKILVHRGWEPGAPVTYLGESAGGNWKRRGGGRTMVKVYRDENGARYRWTRSDEKTARFAYAD